MNSFRSRHELHNGHPSVTQPRRQTHLTDTSDTTTLSVTVIIITDARHEQQQMQPQIHPTPANEPPAT